MFRYSHRTLILISGFLWMAIGCYLLPLGLRLLSEALHQGEASTNPLLGLLSVRVGGLDHAAIIVIACSLFIGFFKGRVVLGKSVRRMVARIRTLPNPASLGKIYHLSYYILLGSMVCIGILIKVFHVPHDIRGAIDVAIGTALIQGAILYFRSAFLPSE